MMDFFCYFLKCIIVENTFFGLLRVLGLHPYFVLPYFRDVRDARGIFILQVFFVYFPAIFYSIHPAFF